MMLRGKKLNSSNYQVIVLACHPMKLLAIHASAMLGRSRLPKMPCIHLHIHDYVYLIIQIISGFLEDMNEHSQNFHAISLRVLHFSVSRLYLSLSHHHECCRQHFQ